MGSDTYHEPYDVLTPETREMHRAIVSLMEELEAIDWYQQRMDGCTDPELREILRHNKDEEVEHAVMTLEWIRRRSAVFDAELRAYLFTDRPILAVEEHAKEDADTSVEERAEETDNSLRIHSLRG